jgi:hypothetical protein
VIAQHNTVISLEDISNSDLKFCIEKNISELLTEFNKAYFEKEDPNLNANFISLQARESIYKLWKKGSFYCNKIKITTDLIRKTDGCYEIRNIPISIIVESENFIEEECVFILSPSGIIDDFHFGLEHEQYNTLLKEGKNVTDTLRRKQIINFVEIYRTAYNKKDIDYIQEVFSEKALIVVGRVTNILQRDKNDLLEKYIPIQKVELIRKDKTQYIKDLEKIFKKNKYISIKFDDIEIYQHPKYDNIYGVTLLQDWNTSYYSDQGYIFLMFEFKEDNNPIIWVRTWQPKKFTQEDEVINLGIIQIE